MKGFSTKSNKAALSPDRIFYLASRNVPFVSRLGKCSVLCLKRGDVKILTYSTVSSVTFLMKINSVELFQYICVLGDLLSFIPT